MNQLNSELKRLLRWSRQAGSIPPAPAPFGFSQQVVRRWGRSPANDSFIMWQRAISGLVWPAAVVVLLGMTILMIQRFATNSSYDLSPAYQLVSMELVP